MQNANKLDCSNTHLLDGFDTYSNAVDPDTAAQAGQAVAQLAGTLLANRQPKSQLQQDVKAVCGKKPLLNIGGKKDKWMKCTTDFAKNQSVTSSQSAPSYSIPAPTNSDSEGKFLGMPKTVGVVVVVGVLAIIGFIAYKKINPSSVVPINPPVV
jgi:hypothetical protein